MSVFERNCKARTHNKCRHTEPPARRLLGPVMLALSSKNETQNGFLESVGKAY